MKMSKGQQYYLKAFQLNAESLYCLRCSTQKEQVDIHTQYYSSARLKTGKVGNYERNKLKEATGSLSKEAFRQQPNRTNMVLLQLKPKPTEAGLCSCLANIMTIIRNIVNRIRSTQSGQQEQLIRCRFVTISTLVKGDQRTEKVLRYIQRAYVNKWGVIFKSEDAHLDQDFIFSGIVKVLDSVPVPLKKISLSLEAL
ncbi:hypothetical protein A0J61_04507 [Choanephora cucurbitarum]|uniref:Uncharacterized protein n=1 Tax=Choanephora cucurbitarum TaxID=101091 RepID=A0A1C7NEB8_9FUNG|nr:hypothetical protein A0J61_04507 [Choanephora cucurbitarum]